MNSNGRFQQYILNNSIESIIFSLYSNFILNLNRIINIRRLFIIEYITLFNAFTLFLLLINFHTKYIGKVLK